jgi:L-alanine-DL-glutamate epimerase-like enolase superfamily enzyme
MRASQLRIGSAPIPFRTSFRHAAAIRERAENVLVEARDGEGRVGLGEGCPRVYVTGEDVPGALAFLHDQHAALLGIDDLQGLRAWIDANAAVIDTHPSAFCAAELALIDLFARQAGQSIETLLGVVRTREPICVSAVYGTSKPAAFLAQSLMFGLNGMRDAKLKIGGDAEQDLVRARSLSRAGRVRLDANNHWPDADAAMPFLAELSRHAWAVEEPIKPRDWPGLARIAQETGLAIILDESLLTPSDFEAASMHLAPLPNLRVSKQGGLLRSLNLLARTSGPVIVGAQVGETSILARAGLVLANAASARLQGFECAYAPLLLTHDVVTPQIGFGRRGRVRRDKVSGKPGSGLLLAPQVGSTLVE